MEWDVGKVMEEAEAEGVKPACLSPENTDRGSMVEDFFSVVKGGSSESITALVAKKLPTPKLMNLWGEGVSFNPDFIRTTVSLPVFVVSRCVFLHPAGTVSLCNTSWGIFLLVGKNMCERVCHCATRTGTLAGSKVQQQH